MTLSDSSSKVAGFKLFTVAFIFTFFTPILVSAHTRWFAQGELEPFISTEPTLLYLLACATVSLVIVLMAYLLERYKLLQLNFLQPKTHNAFVRASSTLSIITGSFFMIAGTHGYLFSPNLNYGVHIPTSLIVFQFIVGLMLVLGVYARLGALALMLLWFSGITFGGVEALIENVWVLSIASFIFIMGNDHYGLVSAESLKKLSKKMENYALPILRVGTGATLLVLGFSEKIFQPELGMNFLSMYHWNFMHSFGFSDYLFVLSAGTVESLLGLLLVLGVMTRLVSVVIAVFFTIPIFIIGPIELAGHLPHFIAIVMLILFGAGEKLRLAK